MRVINIWFRNEVKNLYNYVIHSLDLFYMQKGEIVCLNKSIISSFQKKLLSCSFMITKNFSFLVCYSVIIVFEYFRIWTKMSNISQVFFDSVQNIPLCLQDLPFFFCLQVDFVQQKNVSQFQNSSQNATFECNAEINN